VLESGVKLRGAYVIGSLDLEGATLPKALSLKACYFEERIVLTYARAQNTSLDTCHIKKGLLADNAKFSGNLSLADVKCGNGLDIRLTEISGNLDCTNGVFVKSRREDNAINASLAKVRGNVLLRGAKAKGTVRFLGARVEGSFVCEGASLAGQAQRLNPVRAQSLNLERAQIDGNVFLRATAEQRFEARGTVRLWLTKIGGDLECQGGKFLAPEGEALVCLNAKISGSVGLYADRDRRFESDGSVSFMGAQIDGNLDCSGASLRRPKGIALNLERTRVGGFVGLRSAENLQFRADGTVRLFNSRIGRDLECDGGRFYNPWDSAFDALNAHVDGNVFFRIRDGYRCEATGKVSLAGMKIGGNLLCVGTRFDNLNSDALDCSAATIAGRASMLGTAEHPVLPFHATGGILFRDAKIDRNFDCNGQLENLNRIALNLERARVGGFVGLRRHHGRSFAASGSVRLFNVSIGTNLELHGAQFEAAGGIAIDATGAQVKGSLELDRRTSIVGTVSFAHAEVGALADHIGVWPDKTLILDGFRYSRIDALSSSVGAARVAWLEKQEEKYRKKANFALQPWTHLAKILREQGHFEEALLVDIAKEDAQWKAREIRPHLRFFHWHWLYGKLAVYGYRPRRVLAIALFFWIGFGVLYKYAADQNVFGPTNLAVIKEYGEKCRSSWTRCKELPGEYPAFSPFAYSLDRILPVVSLGQTNSWGPVTSLRASDGLSPSPAYAAHPDVIGTLSALGLGSWDLGSVVRFAGWFEVIIGWAAGLTLAGIVSGAVKRSR
jgi:hypothetical protein